MVDVHLLLGVGLSLGIAIWAHRRGSLSGSGALAATGVGSAIYLGGGGPWFSVLLTFFFTSTLLAKVGKRKKASIKLAFEKGDRRDAAQVLSNGAVAALCALTMFWTQHPVWAAGFLGALATANADTWATELGVLSRSQPYSLLSFGRVARGTSGAVSLEGNLATLGGGLTVGVVAAALHAAFPFGAFQAALIATASGAAGSLTDSLLGATLQRRYHCDACGAFSESAQHHCGAPARPVHGVAGFNNDVVNLLATTCGALLAAGLHTFWLVFGA